MALMWFADAHLDLAIWASRPTLMYDSRAAFAHLVGVAIKQKVDGVFAAGDLINVKRPPSAVVTFIRRQMNRLAEAGIPFFFIQGQHERSEPSWFSTAHDWPTHLHDGVVELDGRVIAGLDWTPAAQLADAIAKIPAEADTLMCHQVWEEFMGEVTNPEGSLSSLPAHITTVVTGDFHSRQLKKLGGRLVFSPGPTTLRKINESGSCGYALSSGPTFTLKSIPGRPVLRVDLRQAQMAPDPAALISELQQRVTEAEANAVKVPEPLRKPILYVVGSLRDMELVAAIEGSSVARTAFLFTSIKSRAEVADPLAQTTSLLSRPKLADILHEAAPKGSPLYNLALSFLSSGASPSETLAQLKKERQLCD